MLILRWASITLGSMLLGGGCFVGWMYSLPRLDPYGKEDSALAIHAMIEGRAVLNVATHWPMTKTGWPIFDRYSSEDK